MKNAKQNPTNKVTTASRAQLDLDNTEPVKVDKDSPVVDKGTQPPVKAKKLKESRIGRYMLTINVHHEAPELIRVDPAVPRSFSTDKVIRKNYQDYNYYPDHDNKARGEVYQSIRDGSSNCLMVGVSYDDCAELHELAQTSPVKAFQRLAELEEGGCATEPATAYDTIRYALVCEPFRRLHLKYLIKRTACL